MICYSRHIVDYVFSCLVVLTVAIVKVSTMKLVSGGNNISEDCEQSSLKLLDDQTFDVEAHFTLDAFETACSCISTSFADDPNIYYVVGTAYAHPDEMEPTKGRLLVFLAKDNKLQLVCEKDVSDHYLHYPPR